MALVVEDGTGLANAESYDSVAGIGVYLAAFGDTSWAAASTAAQEVAARKGTRFIDASGVEEWQGYALRPEQSLAHPRVGIVVDGYELAYAPLPARLKQAQALLSLAALTTDIYPNLAAGSAPTESETIKVGPIEISSTFLGSASPVEVFRLAEDLLRPLKYASTRVVRA